MSEVDIVKGEEYGRPVREMRYNHGVYEMHGMRLISWIGILSARTWDATVLMNDDKIADFVRSTCVCQLFDNVVSTIYSMRIWENQTHFLFRGSTRFDSSTTEVHEVNYLGKLEKFRTRISGCCYNDLGVQNTSPRVFIVDMRCWVCHSAISALYASTYPCTYRLVPRRMQGLSQCPLHSSSILSEAPFLMPMHP